MVGNTVLMQSQSRLGIRAVDLMTGRQLWHQTLGLTEGQWNMAPVAVAGRLFVPHSANATTARVESTVHAYDLATGRLDWIWGSGLTGTISSLQVTDALGEDEVLLSVSERGVDGLWEEHRIVRLDANALDGASAEIARSRVTPGVSKVGMAAPAIVRGHGPEPRVLIHEYSLSSAGVWRSTRVRSLRLRDLAESVPATLSLSGQRNFMNVFSTLRRFGRSPIVIDEGRGRGYVYEAGGSVVAFDLATMALVWRSPVINTALMGRVYVVGDVLVFKALETPTVHGLNPVDGSVLWTENIGSTSEFSGMVFGGANLLLPECSRPIVTPDGHAEFTGIALGDAVQVRAVGRHLLARTADGFSRRWVKLYAVRAQRLSAACAPSPRRVPRVLFRDTPAAEGSFYIDARHFINSGVVHLLVAPAPAVPRSLGGCQIMVDFMNPTRFLLLDTYRATSTGSLTLAFPRAPSSLAGAELILQMVSTFRVPGPAGPSVSAGFRVRLD